MVTIVCRRQIFSGKGEALPRSRIQTASSTKKVWARMAAWPLANAGASRGENLTAWRAVPTGYYWQDSQTVPLRIASMEQALGGAIISSTGAAFLRSRLLESIEDLLIVRR
jgi:hypothetical protein